MGYKLIQKKINEFGLELDVVDYGIASRIGNTIIINKNLLKYEDYCNKVLTHELKHTDKISKHDLVHDMFDSDLIENLTFCFKHPKAFSQFLPIGIYKKKFYIDVNLLVIYMIFIAIAIILVFL